jgi:hypothetical protein
MAAVVSDGDDEEDVVFPKLVDNVVSKARHGRAPDATLTRRSSVREIGEQSDRFDDRTEEGVIGADTLCVDERNLGDELAISVRM